MKNTTTKRNSFSLWVRLTSFYLAPPRILWNTRLTTSVGRRPSPAAALFIMPRTWSIPATF